jgi:hypothetical protein
MKIQSPEQLFGVENTSRKLVVMVHELITVKLPKSIPDLINFARKIKEAEYFPEKSKGVIIKTPWGTIIVNASSFQIQQVREPEKINLLSTFVWESIRSKDELSFPVWFRAHC